MSLDDDIRNNQIVLVVVPKAKYQAARNAIIKSVDASSKKICYVAINKPYNAVIADLKNNGIDAGKFFFVDTVTSTVKLPVPDPNCEFVQSPSASIEISMAFTKAMGEKKCDNAVFDAISTLSVYQDLSEIMKLIHNLINKCRVNNQKSVYIALKEDSAELIKDMTMFVDAIVEQ